MPKYIFDEDVLREYISYDAESDSSLDAEKKLADYTREPDGQLSEYEPAQCSLNPQKLRATAQLVLQELKNLGVTQMVIRYDGGGDEGFTHWHEAKTASGELKREDLVARFQTGPLGEVPETSFFYHTPDEKRKVSRKQWTEEALQLFIYELAWQLLGEGFGNGDYSLEGMFVADLQANTLTDVAPESS